MRALGRSAARAYLHAPLAMTASLFLIDQLVFQDRHLELELAIIVPVVDEQHADELLADIDFGGVILLPPQHDADNGIAEYGLQIRVR
jgi:hypothetical protein